MRIKTINSEDRERIEETTESNTPTQNNIKWLIEKGI